MRICFFAKVRDREILDRVGFYTQDLQILRDLGHDVHVATRASQLKPADLYFIWWWTWAFIPVGFAQLLRRPALITGTFDGWSFSDRFVLHRLAMAFALRNADANVFVSEHEYRQTPAMLRVKNPVYSPHIVDTNLYSPGSAQRGNFLFTVAGMHGPNAERKCLPELVQAAGIVCAADPNIEFIIAGEKGSAFPGLSALARSTGCADRIKFIGIISEAEKIHLLQNCTAYVQPSRYEGFGLAILEAMSCGAPIITSPVGAVPEVVDAAAVLVDGTSPAAIADAIRYLLGNDQERASLSRSGRERAERLFCYERRKRDLDQVINAICAGNHQTQSSETAPAVIIRP